jgi:hypothetical protein
VAGMVGRQDEDSLGLFDPIEQVVHLEVGVPVVRIFNRR